MTQSVQPRREDWTEALRTIWNRTLKNMATRSYEIEREFGVKIPPNQLEVMSFEVVLSRINIDSSSSRETPPHSTPSSKPSREHTNLTPEEEAKARRVFEKLNW